MYLCKHGTPLLVSLHTLHLTDCVYLITLSLDIGMDDISVEDTIV